MFAWIKHVLTEPDGNTFCPLRCGMALTTAVYHGAAAAGLWNGGLHCDIATLGQYAQHMTTLFAAGGVGIGAKSIMKGDAQ
ncbi:MAG: hypothetical protein JO253_06020 [Alphaproteobacteria bacterium]|nr:hypothetical protein [Alphaproteobacteria bacterium]